MITTENSEFESRFDLSRRGMVCLRPRREDVAFRVASARFQQARNGINPFWVRVRQGESIPTWGNKLIDQRMNEERKT